MEETSISVIDQAKQALQRQSERLTVKTMADYVLEHILSCCENDAVFAEKVSQPDKSFMDCIKYIKDWALEWLKEQQKLESSECANPTTVCGDVPNEICYKWAVDYYNSVPAPKPAPKPYVPAVKAKNTKSVINPAVKPDMEDKITDNPADGAAKVSTEQISLLEM